MSNKTKYHPGSLEQWEGRSARPASEVEGQPEGPVEPEGEVDPLPLEPTEELPDDEGSDFSDNRRAMYFTW